LELDRCNILVGEPEGKRELWRLMWKLENNIKIDEREVVCKDLD
jgi:hypothetical protein